MISKNGVTTLIRTDGTAADDAKNSAQFVGLDCLPLPAKFSGAANFICHLVDEILKAPRDFPVAIFCKPQHRSLLQPHLQRRDKLVEIPIRNRPQLLLFYELFLKPRLIRERVGLFWAFHYVCPPADPAYQLVTTFHDMGFYLRGTDYPPAKRLYFRLRLRRFAGRAQRIVAVSQSTARSLLQAWPEVAGKVSVMYPGTDHLLNSSSEASDCLPVTEPFILAVNTFERRKNIPFIVKLFDYLKAQHRYPHRLLLVGHPANDFQHVQQTVRSSPFRDEIVLAQSLPEMVLKECYRRAAFFVNASQYEGFGFTPFEAIRRGCPAFLHSTGPLREMLGSHPHIFDHYDVSRWAEAIQRSAAGGFADKIPATRITHLSWEAAGRNALQLITQLMNTEEFRLVPEGDSGNGGAGTPLPERIYG